MDVCWLWLVGGVSAVLLALGLAAWRVAGTLDSESRSLIDRIGSLPWRAKLRLARALLGDRRVPLWARWLLPALALYFVTPVDIIPDFIPVVGHLDDLAVAILVGALLLQATPRNVLEHHIVRLEGELTDGSGTAR